MLSVVSLMISGKVVCPIASRSFAAESQTSPAEPCNFLQQCEAASGSTMMIRHVGGVEYGYCIYTSR